MRVLFCEGEIGRRSMNGSADPDADFVALVAAEHRGAIAAAVMIVGRRSVAEEIVQDVFERAYVRWPKVARLDRPGAWIRRAVINQAISTARRSKNERRALDRLVGTRTAPTGSGFNGQVREDATFVDFELWSAVKDLPANQSTAVALHYGADLAIETVAAEMGISITAAKSLLHRARSGLRNHELFKEAVP